MYPASSLHNIDFHILIEKHECDIEESIWKAISFVSADFPYNICRNCADENWDHKNFTPYDVKDMV